VFFFGEVGAILSPQVAKLRETGVPHGDKDI